LRRGGFPRHEGASRQGCCAWPNDRESPRNPPG
jgi:hypothetical protein